MPKLNTIRAQALTAVILILLLGMTTLATVLTLHEHRVIEDNINTRQETMLSVFSFDLNSNFADRGFTRQLDDNGHLARVTWPFIPPFSDHVIADNSALQTFGMVSLLTWNDDRGGFTRVTTSAADPNGDRALNTGLSPDATASLRRGEAVHTRTAIGGTEFDIRLIPVLGREGTVIAALEAGVPSAEMAAMIRKAILLGTLTTLICIAAAAGLLAFAVPRVLRSIAQVNAAMTEIAKGHFTTKVPHTTMPDAVGDIARSLEIFARELKSGEDARAAQSAAEDRAREAADRDVATQQRVVSEISEGLQRLASGDLSQPIESSPDNPFPAQYDDLRRRYNDALTQLSDAMTSVLSSAESVRTGATEIDQAAGDLSSRAETQAATLEQSAAALNQLSTSVRQASESAAEAEQAGRNARS
ncbi:MAG: HAMP domain-containing protein, partial [Pseudomonadota bacterium]